MKIQKILLAKPFHLFLVLQVLPYSIQILAIVLAFIFNSFRLFWIMESILMLAGAGLVFGWLFIIGNNLYKKVNDKGLINIFFFRIAVLIPMFYFFIIAIFTFLNSYSLFPFLEIRSEYWPWIISVHILSIFSMFGIFGYFPKIFRTAELQREVDFSDYRKECWLMANFFKGIWIIQPRLIKIFTTNEDDKSVVT